MKKSEITKEASLAEILDLEGAEEVLEKHRLPCLRCPFAEREVQSLTLGQVSHMYGLDLGKILKELKNLKVEDDN